MSESRSTHARFGWDGDRRSGEEYSSPQQQGMMSDARMAKVESVRRAIADDRYHVSAADLAQKLIAYMLETVPA